MLQHCTLARACCRAKRYPCSSVTNSVCTYILILLSQSQAPSFIEIETSHRRLVHKHLRRAIWTHMYDPSTQHLIMDAMKAGTGSARSRRAQELVKQHASVARGVPVSGYVTSCLYLRFSLCLKWAVCFAGGTDSLR